MIKKELLERALKKVNKPARYIGGELNSIKKDLDSTEVNFVFAFPDVYEVGMSHLGLQILYFLTNQENYACERVFAPWPDMEEQMRNLDIPLFTLESKEEVRNFDILGFTLQYELSYTNILNMLDLANIPLYSKDRGEEDPLIVAGGPCAYTPEPLADFIDLFILGEGEEVNLELLDLYREKKKNHWTKDEFLKKAIKIPGIYVPKFYEEIYDHQGLIKQRIAKEGAPSIIKKRKINDLDSMFQLTKVIVPFIETVHDRVVLEMFRGCTHGCRFCQAGMIYRPIREKSVDHLVEGARKMIESTGYSEISLSSLSSCDYTSLLPLIEILMKEYEEKRVALSLPSLRLDTFFIEVLKEIEKVKKTGLTFAPEAGSQRLRDVINKGVTKENLMDVCDSVFREGWSKVKLYFMIGLPTEREEDLDGIVELSYGVRDRFFNRPKEEIKGNFQVTSSASCFVPKGFTPFQWVGQTRKEDFYQKAFYIKDQIKDPKVKFRYHSPETSIMEGVIARGDRRVGKLLYRAWELGAKFDGWSEHFDYQIWEQAMEDTGITLDFYSYRERSLDEILPWDFIDIGVSKKYLIREYQKALSEKRTSDCRETCNGCGISDCIMWETFHKMKEVQ
ncbi:MAG: TIGR03960 family B12-binding radical SAM protein [Tissierellia bacterium]|nr:TIGR03960 family B12-binding radical SAM protein [Tissierellia bacterium]